MGYEAAIARDMLGQGAGDAEILEEAVKGGWILITFDTDFGYLVYKKGTPRIGVVLFRLKDQSPENQIKILKKALKKGSIETNKFISLIKAGFTKRQEGGMFKMTGYEKIKALAKERRCFVKDLLALAPKNDPFYSGGNASREKAEWFARLWNEFGYTTGVHLRRFHYQLVSQPGCLVMLSNSNVPEVLELYRDYKKVMFKARRAVNCRGEKRSTDDYNEILVLNY